MGYSPWGHKKSDMTEQLSSCANIENMDFPGLSGLKKKKNHLPMQKTQVPGSGSFRSYSLSSVLCGDLNGKEI